LRLALAVIPIISVVVALRPEVDLVEEQSRVNLTEDAGGLDLRQILETKILDYLLKDHFTADENTTGYPGSVSVYLCNNRENLKDATVFGTKNFELQYNGGKWKEELKNQQGNYDIHDFLIHGSKVSLGVATRKQTWREWYWNQEVVGDELFTTGVDPAEVAEGTVPESRFPLTFTPTGRPALHVDCASTVVHNGELGIAMAGVEICLRLDFEKFDVSSSLGNVPFNLHGDLTTRVKIPYARLGLSWQANGFTGFFNEEDASHFEVDMLRWKPHEDSSWNQAIGSNVLKFASWLDSVKIPALNLDFTNMKLGFLKKKIDEKKKIDKDPQVEVFDYILAKIGIFDKLASKIAKKITDKTSGLGPKATKAIQALASDPATKTAETFKWFTGFFNSACEQPNGAINE